MPEFFSYEIEVRSPLAECTADEIAAVEVGATLAWHTISIEETSPETARLNALAGTRRECRLKTTGE